MQTMKRIPLSVLVGAAGAMACILGCASMSDSSTKAGDLGRGRFKYACVSEFGDDSACAQGSQETYVFPTSIAVGGSFKLGYEANSDTQQQIGNPVLKPAANDYLADPAPGLFLAKKPGRVAVVARSSSNGKAADFTYLRIAEPTELKLLTDTKGAQPSLKVTMHIGDKPLSLRAEAYSGGPGNVKDRLAGTIEFSWTSSSEAVVKLVGRSPASRMQFQPVAAGTAKIEAKLADKTVSVEIEVLP